MRFSRQSIFSATLVILGLGSAFALGKAVADPLNVVAQRPPASGEQQGQQGQQGQRRERPPRPDFASAASQLGVTEAQLIEALGLPATPPTDANGCPSGPPPRPDIRGAAQKLGVTEEALVRALGIPPHPPAGEAPPNGQPTPQR